MPIQLGPGQSHCVEYFMHVGLDLVWRLALRYSSRRIRAGDRAYATGFRFNVQPNGVRGRRKPPPRRSAYSITYHRGTAEVALGRRLSIAVGEWRGSAPEQGRDGGAGQVDNGRGPDAQQHHDYGSEG